MLNFVDCYGNVLPHGNSCATVWQCITPYQLSPTVLQCTTQPLTLPHQYGSELQHVNTSRGRCRTHSGALIFPIKCFSVCIRESIFRVQCGKLNCWQHSLPSTLPNSKIVIFLHIPVSTRQSIFCVHCFWYFVLEPLLFHTINCWRFPTSASATSYFVCKEQSCWNVSLLLQFVKNVRRAVT